MMIVSTELPGIILGAWR